MIRERSAGSTTRTAMSTSRHLNPSAGILLCAEFWICNGRPASLLRFTEERDDDAGGGGEPHFGGAS